MALSGSTSTVSTAKGAYSIYITWSATQSISNNRSVVTAKLYMKTNGYGTIPYSTPDNGYIIIDGTRTNFSNPPNIAPNQTVLMATASKTINHNDNGSKTFSISGQYVKAGGSTKFTLTIPSRSFTLDTIPRYSDITTFTLSNQTCKEFRINWGTNKNVSNVWYRLNGGSWIELKQTGTSGSTTVKNLNPNTKYDVEISVRNSASSLDTYSSKKSITTYNLSTVSSLASNINTETNFTVGLSRASSSMYHTVAFQIYRESTGAYETVKSLTNQSTSAVFNLTQADWDKALSWKPANAKWNARFIITTYWSDGTNQGSREVTYADRITVVNANPSIASVSYADVNSTIQAILNNDQKILRNKSNLRVVAGQASSQKGAFLKDYTISIGGKDYKVNAGASLTSENGKIINIGKINQSSNQTATVTVTDTRGNRATRQFTVQVLNYEEPQIIFAEAERLNNYEEPTYLKIEGRRSIINPSSLDVNDIEIEYRVKENPSGAFGSWVNITKSNGHTSGLWQNFSVNQYMSDYPNNKSYTVELRIKDRFSSWESTAIALTKGIALLQFMQDRLNAGVPIHDKETDGKYMFFAEYEEW